MTDFSTSQEILDGNRSEFEKQLEEADKIRQQALILLSLEALNSVKQLLAFRGGDFGMSCESAKVALDACKHSIKLSGLEVERMKLGDDADVPLTVVIKQFERKKAKLPEDK